MNCPKCGSADQLVLGDGTVLCLDCRHEHDGTTVPVTHPPADLLSSDEPTEAGDVDTILAAQSADEVLTVVPAEAAPIEWDHAAVSAAAREAFSYVGCFATTPQGETVLIEEDHDDGTVTVLFADGERTQLTATWLTDIEYVPDALAPTVGAETVSDAQPFDPAIFATAALALTQGLACIGADEEQTLLNPRIGWLPPPCDQVPEVEQGVAYAIAILVRTFGLPREGVEQIAATLMEGARAPETETQQ